MLTLNQHDGVTCDSAGPISNNVLRSTFAFDVDYIDEREPLLDPQTFRISRCAKTLYLLALQHQPAQQNCHKKNATDCHVFVRWVHLFSPKIHLLGGTQRGRGFLENRKKASTPWEVKFLVLDSAKLGAVRGTTGIPKQSVPPHGPTGFSQQCALRRPV